MAGLPTQKSLRSVLHGRITALLLFIPMVVLCVFNAGCAGVSISGPSGQSPDIPSPIAVSTSIFPGGTTGVAYSTTLSASGGKAPYGWTVSSGNLPTGLSLSSSGIISGTPTAAGQASFTAEVSDSSSPKQTASKALTITISSSSSVSLQITTTSLADAQQSAVYSATLAAANGTTPYSWSITSGALPSGLSLNGSAGQISGTPTQEGTFAFTVQVKDSSSLAQTASKPLALTVNGTSSGNCPTGQPCGATASYCQNYTPPSTSGATLISSLPYTVTASGNYYLDADLESTGNGISVKASNVDINLNGHTLTYGTVANGSGASQIGEYGVLACNTGNLNSEGLDASYGSNGQCENGGLSAGAITVENGTIVQSPNASQYYDPTNCPGSGPGSGCHHDHSTVASDVINVQYSYGLTVKHITLTWQSVDSDGIHANWQTTGAGHDIECNTFNDEVTQLNNRAYPRGMAVDLQNPGSSSSATTVEYNTILGTPQNAIDGGTAGTVIQKNDINQGFYQGPPFTSELRMYTNDYAIGPGGNTADGCPLSGVIAYNYVHSVAGRGIGCVFERDLNGLSIHDNYVSTTETVENAEYGPNGNSPGATWVSACQGGGGRGFEAKESLGINLYNNTFILSVGACGGVGIVFVEFPCGDFTCPAPASQSFDVHDNTIQINNDSGSSILANSMDTACYSFDTVQGNYSNYFSTPFLQNKCTSDGDYVVTDGYDPGDYLTFLSETYTMGPHPLASGCGGVPSAGCGHMMHWAGVTSPPADELGFVFQDLTFANGAGPSFEGDPFGGSPLARSATVEWTYTPTVLSSATAAPILGATVSAIDAGGSTTTCTTDGAGQCSLVLRQEVITSPAGNATLTTTNEDPSAVTITATGCSTLNYNLTITATTSDSRTVTCP